LLAEAAGFPAASVFLPSGERQHRSQAFRRCQTHHNRTHLRSEQREDGRQETIRAPDDNSAAGSFGDLDTSGIGRIHRNQTDQQTVVETSRAAKILSNAQSPLRGGVGCPSSASPK